MLCAQITHDLLAIAMCVSCCFLLVLISYNHCVVYYICKRRKNRTRCDCVTMTSSAEAFTTNDVTVERSNDVSVGSVQSQQLEESRDDTRHNTTVTQGCVNFFFFTVARWPLPSRMFVCPSRSCILSNFLFTFVFFFLFCLLFIYYIWPAFCHAIIK